MTLAAIQPIQVPLINGNVYSFPHVELKIGSLKLTGGFKSVNYKRTRKRTMVMSNSPDPVGKTIGENEYDADVDVYLTWWLAILKTIAAGNPNGYGDIPFSVNVSYNANGFAPFQDVIQGCTFDSTEASQAAGTDPLVRKIKLTPLKILFNGQDDLATPLQALPI
jgi:hypothetical protein